MRAHPLVLLAILLVGIGFIQLVLYTSPQQESLTYTRYGAGENVLIAIHGSPGSREHFTLLAPLIENYTVYALDMKGFGDSLSPTENYGIATQAQALNAFIQSHNLSSVSLLGYSWGAGVMFEYAYRYPENANSLISLSGMGVQQGELTGNYYLEHARSLLSYPFVVYYPGAFILARSSEIDTPFHYLSRLDQRKGFVRSFIDTDQRPLYSQLQTITTPTLILSGDRDTIVPLWLGALHASLLPQARHEVYHGSHHQLTQDPKEIAELINTFLHETN